MEIRKIGVENKDEIKEVIRKSFSEEPWNDDWQDEAQFDLYMLDLIDNKNSLPLGLYENGELIGVSLGRIKHWYGGTEYWIDDLAIHPKAQGKGCGSHFLDLIEEYLKSENIVGIVLLTKRGIPAYHMYKKKNFVELTERVVFEKHLK